MLVSMLVSRLRRTGIGRSIIAVRENEDAAAANTVIPARMKLTAFAISGGIAAFAGVLFAKVLAIAVVTAIPAFAQSPAQWPDRPVRLLG